MRVSQHQAQTERKAIVTCPCAAPAGSGGALYYDVPAQATVHITNCTFTNNTNRPGKPEISLVGNRIDWGRSPPMIGGSRDERGSLHVLSISYVGIRGS